MTRRLPSTSVKSLRTVALALIGPLSVLVASCAPHVGTSTGQATRTEAPSVDRPLHIGLFDEPAGLGGKFSGGGSGVAD